MKKNHLAILGALALTLASAVAQQTSKHILSSDKMMLAALVDASGYSTAIQQKYQGMFITEAKLNIGGSELKPGQYGFGFSADGKFIVMDVANNDVLNVSWQTAQALPHAVPLKLVEDGDGYKLYGGKKWVAIKVE